MSELKALLLAFCLLPTVGPAEQQAHRPIVFSTSTRNVKLQSTSPEKAAPTISARATYTVTTANVDDTLTGTLTLVFSEDKKAAKTALKAKPGEVPKASATLVKPAVTATFRKDTSCPLIRIEIAKLRLMIEGKEIEIRPFHLEINEARDEMSQLFCFWTKQINTNGHRRGIIAKINRLITGDEEPQ